MEQYFTDGLKVIRLYARAWKTGEDPNKDGLWRVILQPVSSSGMVLAEQAQDYEWTKKDDAIPWAQSQLGPSFRPIHQRVLGSFR
jgi:hypothetical protein